MKRLGQWIACILILTLLVPAVMAERTIPEVLRVKQNIEVSMPDQNRMVTWSVLQTAREDVDQAIAARVNALKEKAVSLVPADSRSSSVRTDVFTQVTRVGNRWMSFHICAQISAESTQLWVKSEDYTYEMDSGRLIRLGDIVREDGWDRILPEIRSQVENFFPDDPPKEDAVSALCRREKLEDAGFVITPGHLALYFPAGDIYPAHAEALLRVEIYVPELREILTEEAQQEMDCSGYDLVALTYDDGPTKGRTREVLEASVCHPGQITFFLVGKRLQGNAELLHREFDSGHSVQSHTWQHSMDASVATPQTAAKWEKDFDRTMSSIIGVGPVMMRPPGGFWKLYQKAGTRLPQILWSIVSQDVGTNKRELVHHYFDCALAAKDGDIVLFHDMTVFAGELAEMCMARFEEKNYLMVTVDDLCALRGVPLEQGIVLENCPAAAAE